MGEEGGGLSTDTATDGVCVCVCVCVCECGVGNEKHYIYSIARP